MDRGRSHRARARACLAIIVLALGLVAPAAARDDVVIYRCTDASGAVTLQNDVRCPSGSQQERRVIETAAPPPYTPPPVAAAPVSTAPAASEPVPVATVIEAPPATPAEPPVPLSERTPPPPLFACRTWNREEYLSDDPVPVERCAPMQTTGLGGDPAQGAGAACLMVTDACQPIPAETLCERWSDHLMRAEAIVEFDRARDPVAARAALERIRTIVAHSTCD